MYHIYELKSFEIQKYDSLLDPFTKTHFGDFQKKNSNKRKNEGVADEILL